MDELKKQPLFFHTIYNIDLVRLLVSSKGNGRENPLWYVIGILLILAIFLAAYFLT